MSQLSSQLVQQWLMIVKGTAGQIQQQVQAQNQTQVSPQHEVQSVQTMVPKGENDVKPVASDKAEKSDNNEPNEITKNEDDTDAINAATFYKTSGKDGKLLIRKSSQDSKGESEDVSDDSGKSEDKKEDKGRVKSKNKNSKTSSSTKSKIKEKDDKKFAKEVDREKDKEKEREKDKDKDKRKSSHSSSSKSSSSSRHKSSSSNRSKEDRDKDKHRDKGKDKERDKSKDSEKDKHRSNGALKSGSSNKSKDKKDNRDKDKEREKEKGKRDEKEKEKQIEKDNNTIEKLKPPSIDKLGRIPKKTPLVEEKPKENIFESKKKGYSVGIRKDKENEERPKTVKVFNSKMRSTGLEEEVKPALPRSVTANKKPTSSVQLPTIPQKRPSPPKDIREPVNPPEKKLKLDKIDIPERPGAIKLIPPKPKRELSALLLFIFILFLQVQSTSRRKFLAATLHHLAGACFSSFLPIVCTRWKTTEFHGLIYFSSLL